MGGEAASGGQMWAIGRGPYSKLVILSRAKDLERALAAHAVHSSPQETAWAARASSRFFASLRMTLLEDIAIREGTPHLLPLADVGAENPRQA